MYSYIGANIDKNLRLLAQIAPIKSVYRIFLHRFILNNKYGPLYRNLLLFCTIFVPRIGLQIDYQIVPRTASGNKGVITKVAIECQGELHCKAVEAYGGLVKLRHQQDLDAQKANYCKSQNIPLEEIWYYDDLESRWDEIINKYHLISQQVQREDS